MANNQKNKFITEKFIEENSKLKAQDYEHIALFAVLYQNINGALADYGFDRRSTLDIFIKDKIKTMVTVIDKIINDPKNAHLSYSEIVNMPKERWHEIMPDGLKTSGNQIYDEQVAFKHIMENNWLKDYMPFLVKSEKVIDPITKKKVEKEVIANKDYVANFLKNFDRTRSKAQDLANKSDKGEGDGFMLTAQDALDILEAKKAQVNTNYEAMHKGVKGSAYRSKLDKDGKVVSGNGPYYERFMGTSSNSAVNQLKEKNKVIRRGWLKFGLKALATLAFAGATIASGGALLAYSGVAFSSFFATGFAGMGLSSAVASGVGAFIGGAVTARVAGSTFSEFGYIIGRRKDRRDFMEGIGKYAASDKDGLKGYKAIEEEYYSALAFSEYLQYGKVVTKKARRFFDKRKMKQMDTDKFYRDYVYTKTGTYNKVELITDRVCSRVLNNKERNMTINELTAFLENAANGNFEQIANGLSYDVKTTSDKLNTLQYASGFLESRGAEIGDIKTRKLGQALSTQYLSILKDELFNVPYDNQVTTKQKQRLDKEEVKKLLERDPEKEAVKIAGSYTAFFDSFRLNKKSDGTIKNQYPNAKLGVSLFQQNKFDVETMQSAASSLCEDLTEEEIEEINDISREIINMSSKDNTEMIRSRIESFSRGKVKDYLNYMLTKRDSASKHSYDSISTQIFGEGATLTTEQENIVKLITNIKRQSTTDRVTDNEFVSGNSNYNDIRNAIDTLSDETQKKIAYKLLEEQTSAILNREVNETALKFMPAVVEGRAPFYGDVKKMIDGLKIEGETSKEQLTLSGLDSFVQNYVTNGAFKPFLECQLRIKIEEVLTTKAQNILDSEFDEIIKLVQTMNNCHFIDQSQKLRIIEKIEPKLEVALDIKLKDIKQGFMTQENMDEIYKLYNPKTGQGQLREVFKVTSPRIKALKEEIEAITRHNETRKKLKGDISLISLGDQEKKDMSDAFMDSKKVIVNGKAIYKGITENMAFMNNLAEIDERLRSISTGNILGEISRTDNGFMLFSTEKIEEILTSTNFNNKERYLLLMTLKNRLLAIFKQHLNRFYLDNVQPTGDTFSSYINKNTGYNDFKNQVYDKWIRPDSTADKKVIDLIDEALETVTAQLRTETGFEYTFNKATESIKQGTNSQKIGGYYNNQTM